ncbi:hypothetical protein KP24_12820 [Pectobacterium atrosepticum]|nr:hypothetical protein JV34_18485 [Pectobacterium atrosepticum]KFX24000.1 hypothetical protein KP24_12820 [Pectobacterium atrosepticum]
MVCYLPFIRKPHFIRVFMWLVFGRYLKCLARSYYIIVHVYGKIAINLVMDGRLTEHLKIY